MVESTWPPEKAQDTPLNDYKLLLGIQFPLKSACHILSAALAILTSQYQYVLKLLFSPWDLFGK